MGDIGSIGKALAPLFWSLAAVLLLPYVAWYWFLRIAGDNKSRYLLRSLVPFVSCTLGYVWLAVTMIYENHLPGNLELEVWYSVTLSFSGGYLVLGSALANARDLLPKTRMAFSILLFIVWCVPYSTFALQTIGPRHNIQEAEDERSRLLRILDRHALFHPRDWLPDDYKDPLGVTAFAVYTGDRIELRATVRSKGDELKLKALIEEAAPKLPVTCQVYIKENSEGVRFTVAPR